MVDLRDSLGSVPLLDSVKSGLCNINSHRICAKTDETLSDCLKMENTITPFLHQRSVSAYYHMIKYFVWDRRKKNDFSLNIKFGAKICSHLLKIDFALVPRFSRWIPKCFVEYPNVSLNTQILVEYPNVPLNTQCSVEYPNVSLNTQMFRWILKFWLNTQMFHWIPKCTVEYSN